MSGRSHPILIAFALSCAPATGAVAQADSFPLVSIRNSSVICAQVVRSGATTEYRFRVTNPATSDAGIASVGIDVSAPLGMQPPMLSGTAPFAGDGALALGATAGHVPVGMDSSASWEANITPAGFAEWYAWGPGLLVNDAIGRESARDFVLRSTYLPGVSGFRLLPEYPHLCCPFEVGDPRNDTIQAHRAEDFLVTGYTVGPRYTPEALMDLGSGLDSVSRDLTQSCALGWIADQSICNSLGAKLDLARQAVSQGDNPSAQAQLEGFLVQLDAQHGTGLPVNENAYWLLKVNADFILARLSATATSIFLHGSGATANPPSLSLSTTAPTVTSAKYKDSPAIAFSGGNPWVSVGTWTAPAALPQGTLTVLGDAVVWLGLKNSDDIGTNFDLRIELFKNGAAVASGETRCIQGVTRNASSAKQVHTSFAPLSPAPFNGTTDTLTIRVLTRIGTTAAGALCGGHANAVGVRLYFDAVSRAAKFDATF